MISILSMQLKVHTVTLQDGVMTVSFQDKVYFYPRSTNITVAGLSYKGYMSQDGIIRVPEVPKSHFDRISKSVAEGNYNILVDNYDLRVVPHNKIVNLERLTNTKLSSHIKKTDNNYSQLMLESTEVCPGIYLWYYTIEGYIVVNSRGFYDILDVNACSMLNPDKVSDQMYHINSAKLLITSLNKIRIINSIKL